MATKSEKISPTAYATGHLWYRLGLSHPTFSTPQGKRLDRAFGVLMRAVGGQSFDNLMRARHLGIDALLAREIEAGRIGQVIELAAGLSARGWRMTQRFPQLVYVETDLPHMASLKRKLLDEAGLLSARLRVTDLDALRDSGPGSLAGIAASLNSRTGTAVITEGLMNYLDPETARGVWRRIASCLRPFPHTLYLADAYLTQEHRSLAAKIFGKVLSSFVRGRLHVHFDSPEHGISLMHQAGFGTARLHEPRELPELRAEDLAKGAQRVRILEARC